MRVVCVWKRETDYGREMEDWLADFEHITGKELESLDPETVEGESFVGAYDIVEFPTIVALGDFGKVQEMWKGMPLPRIDDVLYFCKDI